MSDIIREGSGKQMKKMVKLNLTIVVALLVLLAPACRTRKTVTPATTPTAASTVPDVPPPPPVSNDTTVAEPTDFVRETPGPTEEVIPVDVEELNRWAQQRGYIRDAFFNYDEATLDDAAQTALTASATWLKGPQGAGYGVLIEGHCDERGTEQYNLALGDRRANTAREYLVTLGVDNRRIRTVSYGEERPFEEGHDEAAWAQNRRAHLVLVR
ncbi:MAG TPA: peptidoglycan-associated lipoprotein Pal [Thermoanaerobaculia bacterium]|nr:peptidoglycan-associated lipoprotein Pal [Thermoanaerobaculia bacterium]